LIIKYLYTMTDLVSRYIWGNTLCILHNWQNVHEKKGEYLELHVQRVMPKICN